MDVCCSFKSLVGGQCLAFDRRDRKKSMDIAALLSCTKNITQHKSLDLVKSHCVTLCHAQGRSTCNFLALGKIYGMLILQIRAQFFRLPTTTETVCPFFSSVARFFRSPPTTERVPPFFPRSPAFFARLQLPRQSPSFSSLAPNYRESLPPIISSLARLSRWPPTTERVPPFFFLARPQLPRAWNRVSESSCLFSTQCLRNPFY